MKKLLTKYQAHLRVFFSLWLLVLVTACEHHLSVFPPDKTLTEGAVAGGIAGAAGGALVGPPAIAIPVGAGIGALAGSVLVYHNSNRYYIPPVCVADNCNSWQLVQGENKLGRVLNYAGVPVLHIGSFHRIILPADFFFAPMSTELKPSSHALLNLVIALVREFSRDEQIHIKAYTNSIGSQQFRQELAQQRATTIKKYMLNHGINANRVTVEPSTLTTAQASNTSVIGRSFNDRVEILSSYPAKESGGIMQSWLIPDFNKLPEIRQQFASGG